MTKNFYLTTTLPYVNAEPHIGFALEIVQADTIARYHSLLGESVFFNFGTDEHGQKIYKKALQENKEPQKYADEYAAKFDSLKKALNLSYNNFIRTTDPHHLKASQEIWKRCLKNGYIEKGVYNAKYCVGCELEKQESELVDGRCPLHPTQELELIEEENYFFKFSNFREGLLALYKKYPDFVLPKNRLKEISNFVNGGLSNFSISRLKEKMPWGVPVPGDDKHVMYVWFDALTNYISALGWPEDEKKFKDFWGTVDKPKALQVAGKDNLRQQSAMWQAMLMAAGLPPTRQIFIHGFITSGGQKMSKSLGNVVDPMEYIKKYGTDALRYYLLAKINPTEDSDFTKEKFELVYNGELANGLGNLVARIAKLCENTNIDITAVSKRVAGKENKFVLWIPDASLEKKYVEAINNYKFDVALNLVWEKISELDRKINEVKPWEYKKQNRNTHGIKKFLSECVLWIRDISRLLKPFLPQTAEKIEKQFKGPKIKSSEVLFPRLK
jgi:methionyl-tRNA synthetase